MSASVLFLAVAGLMAAETVVLDLSIDTEHAARRAESALDAPLLSVTHKRQLAPSEDPNDYMSLAPYWWPDPRKEDGLPWVRRDGKRNPSSKDPDFTDHDRFQELARTVGTLALGYAKTGDARFAEKTADLVRTWFLDGATQMNPHLEYAQATPGKTTGRMYGIIDTHRVSEILDGVELIEDSEAWTQVDDAAFRVWCEAYLTWLRESKNGRGASNTHNNHGSWYDVQVLRLSLYLERLQLARIIAEATADKRIRAHIAEDGSMPHEISRTLSFDYTTFNLEAHYLIALMAERVDVDLWSVSDGSGDPLLKRTFDYLDQHAEDWPHPQISEIDEDRFEWLRKVYEVKYES